MRRVSEEERFEIKRLRNNWDKNNKERKLFISNSLSEIKILIDLSNYANEMLNENKST